MRPLAAVERFLERLFERPTARLLGTRLEPVTLARRLERAMDEERRVDADGMLAPTRFSVQVSRADAVSLARLPTLEEDLAGVALDHARRRGYRIPERPTVALLGATEVSPGEVHVTAGFADGRPSPVMPEARPEMTLMHPLPAAIPPGAVLRISAAGRPPRDVALDGRPLTIGRATDVELVLADPMASRRHARLSSRGGRLVLADLGSTNGTRVNGEPVREAVVGPGDRIEIGATRLEIVVAGAPGVG
ncbi:MAG: FhaA domain-containing protein [Chloroflexota bacterium]